MTKTINHALLWLKEFKTIWLPKTIVNDNVLVESISFKLRELEKLLLQNETDDDHRADDEEYHRTKLLNDHSSSNSDTEHIVVVSNLSNLTQEPPAQSLLTPPDVHNQPDEDAEQQAKQILLESSETSDAYESPRRSKRNPNSLSESYRPTIRLLRISAEDAERFLPVGWKKNSKIRKKIKVNLSTPTESSESITKGRKNKKNTLPVRKLLPTTTDETTDSSARQKTSKGGRQKKSSLTSPATTTSLRSITREHLSASSITSGTSAGGKKSKRKLHALNAEADDLITLGDLTSTHGDHTLTNNDCEPIPRHIGPNGILSQTRKLNETSTAAQSTTTTTTSTSEDDQPLKIQVQQKSPAKRGRPRGSTNSPNKRKPSSKKSPTKDHITTTTTNNTVVITYQETANDPSPPHDETTVAPAPNVPDPLPPADTLTLIDDDHFIDDDDQILNDMADESFFASFNMTHERTMESESIPPTTVTTNQNYNIHDDGVEDISNDGIDPPLSSNNFIHGYSIDNTMMMQR